MLRTRLPETVELVSFDGGFSDRCRVERPDRYWMLEHADQETPRIARGGGYSYAAASFGGDSLVTDITRFNRLLGFDEEARFVEVEAGVTLGELLAFTGRRGLGLAVQPGYPAITVGGCIAANVHGKNPSREGTFLSLVEGLSLFHPRYGTMHADRLHRSEVFELTVGGYGLTGVILTAKLKLQPIAGFAATVERLDTGSLPEALAMLRSTTERSAFAYSWHDGVPRRGTFGRGFVYRGMILEGRPFSSRPFNYRRLDPAARGKLPFSLLGGSTARLLTTGFWLAERHEPKTVERSLFDTMFPFARRYQYFLLFGRHGLAEFQAIVPDSTVEGFLEDLETQLLRDRPSAVMISMKLFRGQQRLLRFDGDGVCVTVDFARSGPTSTFLSTLDAMCIEAGALPNLVKDSRLPVEAARRCYREYDEFRDRLRAFDPSRLYRSELSRRLEI